MAMRYTTADVQDGIVRDYQSGMLVRLISAKYGVSEPTVHNIKRQRLIPTRGKVGVNLKPFPISGLERLAELRRDGWAKQELTKEFGVGLERLNRALVELGLDGKMTRRDRKQRVVTKMGYAAEFVQADDPMHVMAWAQSGYVLQHRLVMARSIGRPLRKDETVHHVNGDKTDNRLENLQLRQGRHGRGVQLCCMDCGGSNIEHVPLSGGLSVVS